MQGNTIISNHIYSVKILKEIFKKDPCVAAFVLHVARSGNHTAGIILATLD